MNAGRIFMLAAVPDGRVFGLDQQTLISIGIQLLNACFLVVVLSLILYKPVRNFMKARADRIKAQIQSAQEDREKAEELKAQYEQMLAELDHERKEVLESAHRLAAGQGEQILNRARKEAAAMHRQAVDDIQKERERAAEEIRLHVIEAASMMAEKFMGQSIDESVQDRLFHETMAELEDMKWKD